MSASLGCGLLRNNPTAPRIIPGVHQPHWSASASRKACCTGCSLPSAASPSMVTIFLPAAVTARVSVEQASTLGWTRYIGTTGRTIGMETFGASAPLKELQHKFGFTPAAIVTAAKAQLTQGR